MRATPNSPLDGVRVLDLAAGPMAAVARQLAELGADVIRVEPRLGGADRHSGVSLGGVSLDFVAANLGKRAVALDLGNAPDREAFESLLEVADILIENTAPGSPESASLDVAAIRVRHPALVILSISNFGQSGSCRDWQLTDPVLHALSGELSRSGIPGREPLLPPGQIALGCAAVQAAYVALLAYYNRLVSGLGDRLDFSLLDAVAQSLDPGFGIAGSATAGVPAHELPRGRPEARHQYPILPCADGFVRICVLAPRQWKGMFEWMGRPEEFADPSFENLMNRFKSRRLIPAIARCFADKKRDELEAAGQRHGVPTAALNSLEEALATEHLQQRGATRPVEIVPGVSAPLPAGMLEIDGERECWRRGAPGLGEHQKEASADWSAAARETSARETKVRVDVARAAPTSGGAMRPLEGLRVLDFGIIVAGAEQGRLLADQGAEVLKVENAAFPDGSRQGRGRGKVPVTFAAGHRNKRGLGLNLRVPEGKALFLRLIEDTDIVLSNFKPGTLESLGLDYATLRAINPRLIMADSSAFGSTGPWSKRMGYGPLVRASAGLTERWRYAGEPDAFSDAATIYPDHVAARVTAIGVLALLVRRLRTGEGGTSSLSQTEVMLNAMGAEIAARMLEQVRQPLDGVSEPDAPWGVFPAAGEDEWCVVTARGDTDWRALCAVMERPDLAEDPALASAAGRRAARARVDRALSEWLASRAPRDAMEALQARGVPAGAMLHVADLPEFPGFVDRGVFREERHPLIDEPFLMESAPVRSERMPDPASGPAPLVGEHTREIMRERLGLAPEEIARLIEVGALEAPAPGEALALGEAPARPVAQ